MKERILYDDEFEKQLKEKADQFKMYPSDKVWNEVYSSLHTRRRRFVAGMTFLIGGILFLAGTQLIFPSKYTVPKTIAANVNTPAKPATAGTLHSFTTNEFAIAPTDNSDDQRSADGSLNTTVPFVLHSGIPSDKESRPEEMLELQREKIQTNNRVKPIQPADLKVSAKSVTLLTVPDLNENGQTAPANPKVNSVSTDLVPEKSVTQLTHIHNSRFSWEIYVAPTMNTHYL
ncbi:MAG TPA: hypothetical protein VII44_05715, partial [Puia sp.]